MCNRVKEIQASIQIRQQIFGNIDSVFHNELVSLESCLKCECLWRHVRNTVCLCNLIENKKVGRSTSWFKGPCCVILMYLYMGSTVEPVEAKRERIREFLAVSMYRCTCDWRRDVQRGNLWGCPGDWLWNHSKVPLKKPAAKNPLMIHFKQI